MHQSNLSPWRRILNYRTSKFAERRARRPKWAENRRTRRISALRRMLMSNLVDKGLDTQNVADALPFVTGWSRDLPDGVHEVDAGHPFVDCELGFAAEVVEVFDQ